MVACGLLIAIVTMVHTYYNQLQCYCTLTISNDGTWIAGCYSDNGNQIIVYSPSVMVAPGSLVTIVTMVHTYYNQLQCCCTLTISNGGMWIAYCYSDSGTYVF